jgi:hypothetical protein
MVLYGVQVMQPFAGGFTKSAGIPVEGPPPPGGDRPAWLLEDDVVGIDFMAQELWTGTELITDLTTVMGTFGPYNPARGGTADGYNFGDWTEAGDYTLEWVSDIPALVAGGNFAVRMDFEITPDFYNICLAQFWGLGGNGADVICWGGDSTLDDFFTACDWYGDYSHRIGALAANTPYRLVASNNSGGWRSTLNGAITVVDPTHTPGPIDQVYIGTDGSHHWNGTLRRMIFRPNEMGDTACRDWCNATYPT